MAVKKDVAGRRYVEAEVEVPGSPEQVWDAIATGPGVSSWFVPTEIGEDGGMVMTFGPGMEAVARRTASDPPRRFAAEGESFAPGAPPVATEWIVEAKSGGTCTVRVVHSLFSESDEWDDQLDAIGSGWPAFFRILRLYLEHFAGQHGVPIQVVALSGDPAPDAWRALADALGLAGTARHDEWRAPSAAPTLAGRIESTGDAAHEYERLIRLAEPVAGIAHLFALSMGPQVVVMVRLYLFGGDAQRVARDAGPAWQAWMNERFPPPVAAPPG